MRGVHVPGAGRARRRPPGPLAVPVHAVELRPRRAAEMGAARGRAGCKTVPGWSTSRPTASRAACSSTSSIDRQAAARLGVRVQDIDDGAQQRVCAAAGLDDLHRSATSTASSSRSIRCSSAIRTTSSHIYVQRQRRHAGAAVQRGALRARHGAAGDQSPGPVPGGHHHVRPARRAWRSRPRRRRCEQAVRELRLPDIIQAEFAGDAKAFARFGRRAAAADARRAGRGLHRARRAVREPRASARRSSRRCRRPGSARCWRCRCSARS